MAVVFSTKIENGVTMNEGYCLKCARSLGIPQIDAAVKQMGFSENYDLLLCIGFGYPAETPKAKPRDAAKVKFMD